MSEMWGRERDKICFDAKYCTDQLPSKCNSYWHAMKYYVVPYWWAAKMLRLTFPLACYQTCTPGNKALPSVVVCSEIITPPSPTRKWKNKKVDLKRKRHLKLRNVFHEQLLTKQTQLFWLDSLTLFCRMTSLHLSAHPSVAFSQTCPKLPTFSTTWTDEIWLDRVF